MGDYESLDDLRAQTRAMLERQAEQGVTREYADKVIDQLVEQASVAYPPVLLEHELDDSLSELDRRLRQQNLTLDDYLKMEGKTREQMRDEVRPQAERRLKRSLVLGKVVALEGLTVADDDVTAHIEQLSAPWGERSADMHKVLSTDESRRVLAVDLLTDTAVARLVALAKGEDVPPPAPAEAAQADQAPMAEPAGDGAPESAADGVAGQAQAEATASGVVEA
jgi:trigger factor